jgi:hypothetical protein
MDAMIGMAIVFGPFVVMTLLALPILPDWIREQHFIASFHMDRHAIVIVPRHRATQAEAKATLRQRAIERKWKRRLAAA